MGLFDSLFGKSTLKEKGLKLVKKPGVKPMTDQDIENMLDDVLVDFAAFQKPPEMSAMSREEFSVFIINDLEKQSIFAEKLDSNVEDANYLISGIKILDYSVIDSTDEDRIHKIDINDGSSGLMKEVSKNTIQVHFILDIRVYFMNNGDIVFVSNIIKPPANDGTRASGTKKMKIAAATDYYKDFIEESLDTANIFMNDLESFRNQSKNKETIIRVTLTKHELNDIRSIMSSQNSMTLSMVQWFQADLLNNKQEEIISEIIYLSDKIIKNDSWNNDFFENNETISLDLTEQQIYVIYSIYLMNDNMKKLVGMHSVYSSYVNKFRKIIDNL